MGNECLSRPCGNNGECHDNVNGFECNCYPGFEGEFCEYNTQECLSKPCRNGGTCEDGIAAFECNCMAQWAGPTCEAPAVFSIADWAMLIGSVACAILMALIFGWLYQNWKTAESAK